MPYCITPAGSKMEIHSSIHLILYGVNHRFWRVVRFIRTACACMFVGLLFNGCAQTEPSQSAAAGENTGELTIYVGPPTPFRSAVSEEAVEQFADSTGYHLEFIQFNSWFVRMVGDPPIDILDNLDLFINDDQKLYEGNPIRKRNKPDLIITSTWDNHIREKALSGYFLPISSLFEYSPDYRKAHGAEFWSTNLRDLLAFGIPLYSFQQDDAPAYWLIDSEFRRTLLERPVANFSDFLEFAELAVTSFSNNDDLIATSTIPLGAIALVMEYGLLPLLPQSVESSSPKGAFNTELRVASPRRRFACNRVPVPYRSYQNLEILSSFPFVYSPADATIINVLAKPPEGFDEILRRIGRIVGSGRVDITGSQSQAFSSFLLGSSKALFIPADFGLEALHRLLLMYPETYIDRYEILPVSNIPVTSLEASFRAWIPETTPNLELIANLFTTLSNSEMFETLRYGDAPAYWLPSDPYGFGPGEIDTDQLYLPTGQYLEILTRAGMPERVPAVVSSTIQRGFRIDDTDAETYIHFPSEQHVYDPTPILKPLATWKEVSHRYTTMLSGTDEYVFARNHLMASGAQALREIETELKRQLLFRTSR